MTTNKLGVHEALELHEILTFKTLCATKSATMAPLVSDPSLKALLQQDTKISKQHINDIQGLLQSVIM